MPDETLKCKQCGEEFSFSEKDQAHYAAKQYTDKPKRCKACRAMRRTARGQVLRLYAHVCAQCGKDTEIPCPVIPGRPAFCSHCFER